MPRLALDLPDTLPFSVELPLYLSHINRAGHLDNALLLTLVSEARSRFIRALGFDEGNVDGAGVIVADAAVQYCSEAFHGETMVVAMGAGDFNKYGCDLQWRMRDRASGREVARGKTGIVFFDYDARRITAAPQAFVRSVTALADAH